MLCVLRNSSPLTSSFLLGLNSSYSRGLASRILRVPSPYAPEQSYLNLLHKWFGEARKKQYIGVLHGANLTSCPASPWRPRPILISDGFQESRSLLFPEATRVSHCKEYLRGFHTPAVVFTRRYPGTIVTLLAISWRAFRSPFR